MSSFRDATVTRYLFDDIVISCHDFRVIKSGEQKVLPPRAFDVLRYLIEHRDRVVGKAELIERVWEQRFVSDNALTRAVADVRRSLGDSVSSPRYIKTVPKRGYRFVATVIEERAIAATDLLESQTATGVAEVPSATGETRLSESAAMGPGIRALSLDWPRWIQLVAVLFVTAVVLFVFLWLCRTRPPNSLAVIPINDADVGHGIDHPLQQVGRPQADRTLYRHPDPKLVKNEPSSAQDSASYLHRQKAQQSPNDSSNEVEAYGLYLEGRQLLDTLDAAKAQHSIECFKQAIALNPKFALAYVGLADFYINIGSRGEDRPEESILMAKAAAYRALELDATLAEAHATMGVIFDFYDWNLKAAEKEIRWALKLGSTSESAHSALAMHLGLQGRLEESLAESRKVLALDPRNARLNLNVGLILYSMRQYEQAAIHFQKMLAAGVYVPGSYSWLSRIFEAQGRYDQAVDMDLKYRSLSRAAPKSTIEGFRSAYVESGWKGYWQKVVEQRKEVATRRYVEPYGFAIIYARLGEKDLALQSLEKAYSDKSKFITRLPHDPVFDSLRSEPRFQDLLRRTGLKYGS